MNTRFQRVASVCILLLWAATVLQGAVHIVPAPLPGGSVGTPYATVVKVTGSQPPLTWSITAGALPPGLALGSDGVISGTPTAGGDFQFTLHVQQVSDGRFDEQQFTISVSAVVVIITTALPSGTVGTFYSQALSASGGSAPYTWNVISGSLPPGLASTGAGQIGGTPTTAGQFAFTVSATDSSGASATQPLTISIAPPPLTITTSLLPGATVGAPYTAALVASGGTPPYSWSVAAGTLPAGLTLSTTGQIAGTPTTAGPVAFTVQLSDSSGTSLTRGLSITVSPAPLSITTTSLTPATVDQTYTASLSGSGGTTPYSWSLDAGPLPTGLALSPGGQITGRPTSAGSVPFTVRLSDSSGASVTHGLNLNVSPAALTITTTSLNTGTVGQNYNDAVNGAGGQPPYSWSLASGSLPGGLALSNNGHITGTPTAAGSFPFTVRLTDSNSTSVTQPLSITISSAALTITTTSLAPATAGQAYAASLTGSGGTTPYTWSIASGTLPAGLSLSTSGQITGSPTAAGTSAFTVRLTDATSASVTQPLSITVNPSALTITTTSFNPATVGQAYTASLNGSGGTTPYSWSIASGSLPAGLSLSTTGQITGTPTAAGTSAFTVRLTDATSASVTQPLSITVNPSALTITTTSLNPATVGQAYTASLTGSGGTTPYSWSIASGSLPAGLSLSTTGQITGSPTAAGTSPFTVRLTDATSASVTQPLSITVNPSAVAINTSSLTAGNLGQPYTASLSASGGVPPYTWSITAGALPAGLSLASGGQITGTPTSAGLFSFTVKAADSAGGSATAPLSIRVNTPALTIATTTLPPANLGHSYSISLSATGGTQPYAWSLTAGALPAGLALSAGGQISGTPTSAGTASFTVKVADSANASATQALSLTVQQPAITVTTTSVPAGSIGQPYTASLAASGGTPPYSWSLASGSLPAGLSLSPSGQITGTPTAAGSTNFTVRATDAASASATQPLSITIAPAPLVIQTSSLPGATVGVAYSQALAANGGTQPYSWTVSSGSLPPGVALSTAGAITGTPTTTGGFAFTVKATDTRGVSANQSLSITVAPGLAVASCPAAAATVGQSYSSTATATGGSTPYTWTLQGGQLPAGLTLASSGAVSGSPTAAGTFSFTLKVADALGAAATSSCSILVGSQLSVTTTSVAAGVQNVPYTQSLSATGGQPPYSWTLASGALPAGLSLSSSGQIGGVPTSAGVFAFAVRAADSAGAAATQNLSMTVTTGIAVSSCPAGTGVVGLAYSGSATATGGAAPYSFSIAAGQLPLGLSIAPNGAFAGTPSISGTFNFTVQVTDASSNTSVKPCLISINPALVISTSTLADANVSGFYTQQLSATGGTPPYTWSVAGGALPPGLSLNPGTGQITGTAATPGLYPFTLRVADAAGAAATRSVSINVGSGVSIFGCPTATAASGGNYASTVAANGGVAPYAWAVSAGQLPVGLTLTPSTGVIAGVPTAGGNFDFVLAVTDASSATAQLSCSIVVSGSLAIASTSVPDGTINAPYSAALQASGGAAPYTWTTTAGSLPPGVTLTSAGLLTGTPTTAGSFTFTARVVDAAQTAANRDLTIAIVTGLAIPACPIPLADAGATYSSDLVAVGGTTPYSWTVATGTLPPGLSLNSASGRVSGTPVEPGTFSFGLHALDATGRAADRSCTLAVSASLSIGTTSLPDGALGTPYSQTLAGSGGTPPYVWTAPSGNLPPGLFLNSGSGQITGTPTAAGTYQFSVKLADSAGASLTGQVSLVISTGLTISACPAATGARGADYSSSATVQGGTPPYVWSIQSGALPAGLSLDASTGAVSGVPTAIGISSYYVGLVDAAAGSATRSCTLSISGAGAMTVTTPPTLVAAVIGSAYSVDLAVSGGVAPYAWRVLTGALPPGVNLDPAGRIAGTPTTGGSYQFSLEVTDSAGGTAVQAFSLPVVVAPAPSISYSGLSDFVQPAQQPTFKVSLGTPYPAPLEGTLTLTFTPDPGIGVDDPAIKLANGTRTMTFALAANQTDITLAPLAAFQTGTVAGTIQLSVTLRANGIDMGQLSGAQKSVRVERLAPKITNVAVTKTTTGLQFEVTGYTTTRELASATFEFRQSGTGVTTQATVALTSAAATWFSDTNSWKFGGLFKFTLPFNADPAAFNSATVSLSNAQGVSEPVSVSF